MLSHCLIVTIHRLLIHSTMLRLSNFTAVFNILQYRLFHVFFLLSHDIFDLVPTWPIFFLPYLLPQNTMFLVNYPCSQPTPDIPVNTAPSPTSQTCSQTARHQEKLAHHCLPHFSALWVFIKLGNQGNLHISSNQSVVPTQRSVVRISLTQSNSR